MSLFTRPLLVIDTETTGLLRDPDAQPWEIAAVLLDVDGQEVDRIEAIGRPALWRDDMARIVAMGGQDVAELLAMPPLADGLPELLDWMSTAAGRGARPTAFNIAFDQPMLARIGLELPGWPWAPCIMERAKKPMSEAGVLPWFRKYNDYKLPSLSEAASFYQVPQQQPAHRALADARTAGLIAVALQRRAISGTAA